MRELKANCFNGRDETQQQEDHHVGETEHERWVLAIIQKLYCLLMTHMLSMTACLSLSLFSCFSWQDGFWEFRFSPDSFFNIHLVLPLFSLTPDALCVLRVSLSLLSVVWCPVFSLFSTSLSLSLPDIVPHAVPREERSIEGRETGWGRHTSTCCVVIIPSPIFDYTQRKLFMQNFSPHLFSYSSIVIRVLQGWSECLFSSHSWTNKILVELMLDWIRYWIRCKRWGLTEISLNASWLQSNWMVCEIRFNSDVAAPFHWGMWMMILMCDPLLFYLLSHFPSVLHDDYNIHRNPWSIIIINISCSIMIPIILIMMWRILKWGRESDERRRGIFWREREREKDQFSLSPLLFQYFFESSQYYFFLSTTFLTGGITFIIFRSEKLFQLHCENTIQGKKEKEWEGERYTDRQKVVNYTTVALVESERTPFSTIFTECCWMFHDG